MLRFCSCCCWWSQKVRSPFRRPGCHTWGSPASLYCGRRESAFRTSHHSSGTRIRKWAWPVTSSTTNLFHQGLGVLDSPLAIGNSDLLVANLPVSIKDDQRWNAVHTISLRCLSSYIISNVQLYDFYLAFQVLFNPIHDGLCHQAQASGVAVEFNDDGLP